MTHLEMTCVPTHLEVMMETVSTRTMESRRSSATILVLHEDQVHTATILVLVVVELRGVHETCRSGIMPWRVACILEGFTYLTTGHT